MWKIRLLAKNKKELLEHEANLRKLAIFFASSLLEGLHSTESFTLYVFYTPECSTFEIVAPCLFTLDQTYIKTSDLIPFVCKAGLDALLLKDSYGMLNYVVDATEFDQTLACQRNHFSISLKKTGNPQQTNSNYLCFGIKMQCREKRSENLIARDAEACAIYLSQQLGTQYGTFFIAYVKKDHFTLAIRDKTLAFKEKQVKKTINEIVYSSQHFNPYFVSYIPLLDLQNEEQKFATTNNSRLLAAAAISDQDIPKELLCNLTCQVMSFPCYLTKHRVWVDKGCLSLAISDSGKDPFSREPMSFMDVCVNVNMQKLINNFVGEILATSGIFTQVTIAQPPYIGLFNHTEHSTQFDHLAIVMLIKDVIATLPLENLEQYTPFIAAFTQYQYSKALRCACTGVDEVSYKLIETLLKYKDAIGLKINEAAGPEQLTALHHATRKGNHRVYDLLIQHGADTSQHDKSGKTAQEYLQPEVRSANCTL
jgi:hypothetical protein